MTELRTLRSWGCPLLGQGEPCYPRGVVMRPLVVGDFLAKPAGADERRSGAAFAAADETAEVPGVRLGWSVRPAEELAGDFLGAHDLDGGRLGVFVVDV